MTIQRKWLCILLACALMMLAAGISGHATTIERMSVEKLSQVSQTIVRARCLSNSEGWDSGEIWTLTSFAVDDVWKGSAAAQISVRLLGGRVGSITSTVSGVPRFHPGEEVVLFLEAAPHSTGEFSVVSWQQGTFRVRRATNASGQTVTQDSASFATFDPVTRRFEASGVRDASLDLLRSRVDAALHAGAGSK